MFPTIWLIAILDLIYFATGQSSPYCNFAPLHALCLQDRGRRSCERLVQYRGISPSDTYTIVDHHNQMRSLVAQGKNVWGTRGPQLQASNMMIMEWDEELAIAAQKYADQCLYRKDCSNCQRVSRFGAGQKAYIICQTSTFTKINWPRVIATWYHEVSHYNRGPVNLFQFPTMSRLYSQILWWNTIKVGCGFGMFLEEGLWKKLYVCHYGLSGSIISSQMYRRGLPCSACPDGSKCSQKYPGLCDAPSHTTSKPSMQRQQQSLVEPQQRASNSSSQHKSNQNTGRRQRREGDPKALEEGGSLPHSEKRPLEDDLFPFLQKIGKGVQVIHTSSIRIVQKIRNEVLPPRYKPVVLYRPHGGKIIELDADTFLPTSPNITEEPKLEPTRLLSCDLDFSPCHFTQVGGNWTVENGTREGKFSQTFLGEGEKALLVVQEPVKAPSTGIICLSVSHRRDLLDPSHPKVTLPEFKVGVMSTGGLVVHKSIGGTHGLWEMATATISNLTTSFLVVITIGPASGNATVAIDAIQITDGGCCLSGIC